MIGDGLTADALVYAFDIDALSNIAFGGTGYYDTSTYDKPMLGYFHFLSNEVKWMHYYYNTSMESVKAVAFDRANPTSFFFAATVQNYKLLKVSIATGLVVQTWQTNIG